MIDGLDRDKVARIAGAELDRRPELARLLGRSVGSAMGWRARCDLLEGDFVLISVRSMTNGATIALAEVPRADVTLDPEPREAGPRP